MNWTPKDERKYKHILDSCTKDKKTCKRIAAATVNRDRGKTMHRKKNRRPSRSMLDGFAGMFGSVPTEAAITLAIIGGGATLLIATTALAKPPAVPVAAK